MKLSYYNKLSLAIMALVLIMMLASFIPDYLHGFFGDWYCGGATLGKWINETTTTYGHFEKI